MEKQLGLDPLVTSVNTSGWAYCKESVRGSIRVNLQRGRLGTKTYQGWIHEAKRALASRDSFLVDSGQDCGPNWCRQGGATDTSPRTLRADNERVADGRHIGVSTAAYLVDAVANGGEVGTCVRVASEVQRDSVEVSGDLVFLVIWSIEVVCVFVSARQCSTKSF